MNNSKKSRVRQDRNNSWISLDYYEGYMPIYKDYKMICRGHSQRYLTNNALRCLF